MSEKTEVIQKQLTEAIISQLENNPEDWTKPWQGAGRMPHNPQSGTIYSGGNYMVLMFLSPDPADPRWSTYKGWAKLGGNVKKGETGTPIIYWGRSFVCETCGKWSKNECKAHPGSSQSRMMARSYSVFHASQVENAPKWEQPEVSPLINVEDYRKWFKSIGADWRETPSDRAFYSPSGDYINTPEDVQFEGGVEWFGVVAHEFTHWTGAESRLNRKADNNGERTGYAFEELVAELGAVFLSNHLGCAISPRKDHGSYIASWLKALNGDHRFVWDAASKASKAFKFLTEAADEIPSPELAEIHT